MDDRTSLGLKFTWQCQVCNERIASSSVDALAARREVHERFHAKALPSAGYRLEEKNVFCRERKRWVPWFDVEFLHKAGISPIIDDVRSQTELEARYKARPNHQL